MGWSSIGDHQDNYICFHEQKSHRPIVQSQAQGRGSGDQGRSLSEARYFEGELPAIGLNHTPLERDPREIGVVVL